MDPYILKVHLGRRTKRQLVVFVSAVLCLLCLRCLYTWYAQRGDDPGLVARQRRYAEYRAGEARRTGPGEMGVGVYLSEADLLRGRDLYEKEGFNVVASDLIALDRSLPDPRPER